MATTPDVLELLTEDHDHFKRLVEKARNAEPEERKQIVLDLQKRVKVHSEAEEEIVYPAYAESGGQDADELVAEAMTEHEAASAALRKLVAQDPATDAFDGALSAVEEELTHHADEEEAEMFPTMKKRLGTEQRQEMGKKVAKRLEGIAHNVTY